MNGVRARTLVLSGIAIIVGVAATGTAQLLIRLVGFLTSLSFFGRLGFASSAAGTRLGWGVVFVPVVGGLIVGLMARFGSEGIRGHGIPEAIEQVLVGGSRVPPRLTWLKPISAAFAIGTGGPFGTEGPIIATGGGLGSLAGQLTATTAAERKVLLAAGAAAGMAAIFGTPVAAVLLAIELFLFELSARSLVPVALATATAAGLRMLFTGNTPVFPTEALATPTLRAMIAYAVVGALIGLAAVGVTRLVYWIEDLFAKLPLHWMWWPALGAVAVGLAGVADPRVLGVGYDNIDHILGGSVIGTSLIMLCGLKLVAWSVALGSGTSGGTLAPLLTIGGGAGALLGAVLAHVFPGAGIDPRMAALVGMAAMFAGASRALLASVVFAFEATRQTPGLLPLLAGCTCAFGVSMLLMEHTIMTEKIARRGIRVVSELMTDFLDQVFVSERASRDVVVVSASDTLAEARSWLVHDGPYATHQGFPVVDTEGHLVGLVTRRELLDPSKDGALQVHDIIARPPVVVFEDASLREAADTMVREGVGRLVVVARRAPTRIAGIITRSDVLSAHARRIEETTFSERILHPKLIRPRPPGPRPTEDQRPLH